MHKNNAKLCKVSSKSGNTVSYGYEYIRDLIWTEVKLLLEENFEVVSERQELNRKMG